MRTVDRCSHGDVAWALEPGSAGTYLVLPDAAAVDALHARATDAGATDVGEPHETDYGSHETAVRDPEGNRWSIGTYPGHTVSQGQDRA